MSDSQGILLFTTDSAAGSASSDYDKDVFQDVSLPASNNSGFSSTVSTNPLNGSFANDAAPKWMAKTLFIKDLQRVEDRSLWINGRATYKIIWNESFPGADGYVFGSVSLTGTTESKYVQINDINDGIGVTGIIRRVMWLVRPKAGTATATPALDGGALSAINYGGYTGLGNNFQTSKPTFNAYVNDSSNASLNIHDHQLKADQANLLEVTGCVVYYNVPGDGVDLFSGTVYVDKSRTSLTGSTLAYTGGSSNFLGGWDGIYANSNGAFSLIPSYIAGIGSNCSGASGTNLVSVDIGTGSSFPVNSGVFVPAGSTHYLGQITNVSGDVLTVSPTLPFGFTGLLDVLFNAGGSYGVSLGMFSETFNFQPGSNFRIPMGVSGVSSESPYSFSDPYLRYRAWGSSLRIMSGSSMVAGLGPTYGIAFSSNAHFLNFEGQFSALEFEFLAGTTAVLSATFGVDGIYAQGVSQQILGPTVVKRTVFTNAGMGYHSVNFSNTGSTNILLSRIVGYQPKIYNGPTFGLLSQISVGQTFILRNAQNATLMALGGVNRVFAESVRANGSSIGSTAIPGPGGRALTTINDGDYIDFQFFGTRFSLLGTPGTSMTYLVNGGATSLSWNAWNGTGLTLGFHDIRVTYKAGTSFTFFGYDYLTNGMVKNQQTFTPLQYQSNYTRVFTGPSEPKNAKTGDIWEVNPNAKLAYQNLFGGWQLMQSNNARVFYARSISQVFAAATLQIIDFDTLTSDPMGLVTTGTSWKYTAVQNGNYSVNANLLFEDNLVNPSMAVAKNGLTYRSVIYAGSTSRMLGITAEVPLSVGDFVDVRVSPGTIARNSESTQPTLNNVSIGLLR